ncbi:50S ribosomal protein L10 [Defluviicoccus vanus]|uniref:Large ribosomal subunit protein uL10 n=1 Tax=Defluviicoccus vanus TaxID=111831 RepID=A0A7H1MZE9_9PROT|nr:50S ribosomal protein L10 [Defluviicoccus vanus]QNT68835.1 50S ribosomal protein L10 [Defluviicoccus vanus]
MDRTEKEDLVASLHRTFNETAVVLVSHYKGLTVAEMGELRARMREAGAALKVAKNRLARLALAGTPYAGLNDLFTGPTAVAYAKDPVAAAKVAVTFAKTNPKLVLLGGGLGSQMLDAEGVKSLASLPSLDELRGKLIGLLNAPATRIAGVLQAPGGQVARVLAAYADKSGETTSEAA